MGINVIGSGDKAVAVVVLDKEARLDIGEVVKEITGSNKNVKSVLEAEFGAQGDFRLNKKRLVWGDEDTEVVHREHGYVLRMDPRKVYFSPRESTVRRFVSERVGKGERVLVMFAGVGPYPISIARARPDVQEVVAVEMNPDAVRYMRDNVRMNKVSHLVTPVEGDVSDVCGVFDGEFDRVIMPMIFAKDFLGLAVKSARSTGTVDIYMTSGEEDFADARRFLDSEFGKMGRGYEIKETRKISLYSPGKFKVLIEIKLK